MRDSLLLYCQVVGKVRMANEATTNHWWSVPLYVTARGLTTSLISHPTGRSMRSSIRARPFWTVPMTARPVAMGRLPNNTDQPAQIAASPTYIGLRERRYGPSASR